jgi:hypothetical protein
MYRLTDSDQIIDIMELQLLLISLCHMAGAFNSIGVGFVGQMSRSGSV